MHVPPRWTLLEHARDQQTLHLPTVFRRLVSRRVRHFCVWFNGGLFLCQVQTCFVGRSFSELSWDSCLVRGTLDISWYCGDVAAVNNGVVSRDDCWLWLRVGGLQLLRSWSCGSALVVLIVVESCFAKLDVLISVGRAACGWVQPLAKLWTYLSSFRAENSFGIEARAKLDLSLSAGRAACRVGYSCSGAENSSCRGS